MNMHHTFFRTLLLCLGLFAGSLRGMAATDTTLNARLTAVSMQLFNDSNRNFIFVQALKDGIIKPEQPYSFLFEGGKVSFNDQPLPAPLQNRYVDMINRFAQQTGIKMFASSKCDGIRLSDVFDPTSSFRRKDRSHASKDITSILLREMMTDKLIADSNNFQIKYNVKGVFVNQQKLKGALEAKYKQRISELDGVTPDGPGDEVSISRGNIYAHH